MTALASPRCSWQSTALRTAMEPHFRTSLSKNSLSSMELQILPLRHHELHRFRSELCDEPVDDYPLFADRSLSQRNERCELQRVQVQWSEKVPMALQEMVGDSHLTSFIHNTHRLENVFKPYMAVSNLRARLTI